MVSVTECERSTVQYYISLAAKKKDKVVVMVVWKWHRGGHNGLSLMGND